LTISSHSLFATEAAIGVWLLLFWLAAFITPKRGYGNPWPSGSAFYCITFLLSVPLPARGNSPDEVSFRHTIQSPRRKSLSYDVLCLAAYFHFQFNSGPKPFCFLKPCDSIVERTLPVSSIFRTSVDQVHFVQTSALLTCRPGGLNEPEVFHLSNPFRFHIFQAALYRSPDESNLQ
jgi:hypothetical protein